MTIVLGALLVWLVANVLFVAFMIRMGRWARREERALGFDRPDIAPTAPRGSSVAERTVGDRAGASIYPA